MFEHITSHIDQQKSEINRLRLELQEANRLTVDANRKASSNLAQALEEEHATAQTERDAMMSQIRNLLEESSQKQTSRLKGKFDTVRTDLSASGDSLEQATAHYDRSVDEWIFKEEQFAKDVNASRDDIKTKMQNDWEVRKSLVAIFRIHSNRSRHLTNATPRFSGLPSPCTRRLFELWMLR
jgi:kinesin family protein 11